MTARSREAAVLVPLKRAPRARGSSRKQLWVERVVGSRLRLKCAEENSGRSGVGSMNDARPASASGPRAGSSRGAEGAAGRPDTSDGEEGVRTGIVHNAGVLGIGRARFLHIRRRVGYRGCKTRGRSTIRILLSVLNPQNSFNFSMLYDLNATGFRKPLPVTAPR